MTRSRSGPASETRAILAPPRLIAVNAAADEPLGSPAAASEAACRGGGGRLAPTGASRGARVMAWLRAPPRAMTGTARSAAGQAAGVSGPSLAGDERIRLGTAYRGADHGMVDKLTMAGRVARLRGFGLGQLIAFPV